MHELSIVMGIIDLAEEQVRSHGATMVEQINLEIGELAGIDWPALDFAWKSAIPETVLAQAECVIDKVRGEARCMECNESFNASSYFDPCPKCHQYLNEITKGKELRVKSMILN